MYTFETSADRHKFELSASDEWVHGPSLKIAINKLLKFDFRLKTHRIKALNIVTSLTSITVSLNVRFPSEGFYANITRQPWLNRIHRLRIILSENRELKYNRTLNTLYNLLRELCDITNDVTNYSDRALFESTCYWR